MKTFIAALVATVAFAQEPVPTDQDNTNPACNESWGTEVRCERGDWGWCWTECGGYDNGWKVEPTVWQKAERYLDLLGSGIDETFEFFTDPEKQRREIEKFMEDFECWWADRDNGDGKC